MYDPNYKVTSLYSYLERNKTLYGDKAVFKFNKKDEVVEVSYNDLFTLVHNTALALKEVGVAGKKVILIGDTSVQWIVSYLATVAADGIIIPLDPNLLEDEIIKFTNKTEAAIVVHGPAFDKLFAERESELRGQQGRSDAPGL